MKKNDIMRKLDKRFGGGNYSIEESVSLTAIPHEDLVILAGVVLHYTEGGRNYRRQGWGTHSVSSFMSLDRILPGAIDSALVMALDNVTEGLLDRTETRMDQLIS